MATMGKENSQMEEVRKHKYPRWPQKPPFILIGGKGGLTSLTSLRDDLAILGKTIMEKKR